MSVCTFLLQTVTTIIHHLTYVKDHGAYVNSKVVLPVLSDSNLTVYACCISTLCFQLSIKNSPKTVHSYDCIPFSFNKIPQQKAKKYIITTLYITYAVRIWIIFEWCIEWLILQFALRHDLCYQCLLWIISSSLARKYFDKLLTFERERIVLLALLIWFYTAMNINEWLSFKKTILALTH